MGRHVWLAMLDIIYSRSKQENLLLVLNVQKILCHSVMNALMIEFVVNVLLATKLSPQVNAKLSDSLLMFLLIYLNCI